MGSHSRIPAIPGKSDTAMDSWFQKLYVNGLLFNPDDRPENIVVIETGEPTFNERECLVLNAALERLFEHHGDKVYEVAAKYFYKAAGIAPEYASA